MRGWPFRRHRRSQTLRRWRRPSCRRRRGRPRGRRRQRRPCRTDARGPAAATGTPQPGPPAASGAAAGSTSFRGGATAAAPPTLRWNGRCQLMPDASRLAHPPSWAAARAASAPHRRPLAAAARAPVAASTAAAGPRRPFFRQHHHGQPRWPHGPGPAAGAAEPSPRPPPPPPRRPCRPGPRGRRHHRGPVQRRAASPRPGPCRVAGRRSSRRWARCSRRSPPPPEPAARHRCGSPARSSQGPRNTVPAAGPARAGTPGVWPGAPRPPRAQRRPARCRCSAPLACPGASAPAPSSQACPVWRPRR
mmetsp:Transcript_82275/g.245365  ORF Transcript_82275/g.245365 Transcript_82275/m.245365 type:complete len:305 (+) Transcript_82275:374-1288(+)